MNQEAPKKTKVNAAEIEVPEDFQISMSEIKKMQKFASEVSPFLLGLLEAKEERNN